MKKMLGKNIIGKNIRKKTSDTQELDYEEIAARQAEMKAAAREAEEREARRLAELHEESWPAAAGSIDPIDEAAPKPADPIAVDGWQKEVARERKQEEEEEQEEWRVHNAGKRFNRKFIPILAAAAAVVLIIVCGTLWYTNFAVSATAITKGEAPIAFYLNHHEKVLESVPVNEEAYDLLKSMGDLGSRPDLKAVLKKTERAMRERGLLAEDEHLKYSIVKGRAKVDAYHPADEDGGSQVNQWSDDGDSDSRNQDDSSKDKATKPKETRAEPTRDSGSGDSGGQDSGSDTGGSTPGGDTGGDTGGGTDSGGSSGGGDTGGGTDSGGSSGGGDAGGNDSSGDTGGDNSNDGGAE